MHSLPAMNHLLDVEVNCWCHHRNLCFPICFISLTAVQRSLLVSCWLASSVALSEVLSPLLSMSYLVIVYVLVHLWYSF